MHSVGICGSDVHTTTAYGRIGDCGHKTRWSSRGTSVRVVKVGSAIRHLKAGEWAARPGVPVRWASSSKWPIQLVSTIFFCHTPDDGSLYRYYKH
ncbi:sorbitol dehydrogenase, partial [Lates japonicus]